MSVLITGTGPTVRRVFVFPDANATILTTANPVTPAQGGTGLSSYVIGDLLYASGATTLAALNAVAAGSYLRSGGVGAAPVWSTLVLPNAATQGDLMIATAANTLGSLADVAAGSYLRSGGVGAAPVWSTLVLPNAATQGDLIIASAANTLSSLADVATGSVLISGGVGAAPSWSATPSVTRVLVGDGIASANALAFSSESNTGFSRTGAGVTMYNAQGGNSIAFGNNGAFTLHASGVLGWASAGVGAADTTLSRAAAGKLTLTGTTPTLQFGGTTSAFPCLRRVGSNLVLELADGTAGGILFGQIGIANTLISSGTPSISSGFGTSPSVSNHNGPAALRLVVGTGGVASSGVVALPTATNGWAAQVQNLTAAANHRSDVTRVTATGTTSITLENQVASSGAATAWTAGDVLLVSCFAY